MDNFLRKKYDELESDIARVFSDLTSRERIEFEDNEDDYYEVRSDITGDVYDVHVLLISRGEIHSKETDNYNKDTHHILRLCDLSNLRTKIDLVESIAKQLKK